jgi:hypothetical protein
LPAGLFPSPQATSSLKDVLNNPSVDLFLPEKIFPGPRRPPASRTCVARYKCFPKFTSGKNSSKRVKNGRFFHFEDTADFFAESTFFTYSHKFQNLSFNLAVMFFLCSLRHRIYRQNKCIQDFNVTLYQCSIRLID